MPVRLKTLMAGPEGVSPAGSVVNVSRAEADALIAGGFAEALEQPEDPVWVNPAPQETATVKPGRRAVKPAARTRKTQ